MGRRKVGLVFGVWAFLLLTAVFSVVLNVRLVRASGTIYIRADGSIDPPTTPITSADNVTYTFNDNIYDSIVVERNSTIIDGAGYTLQGTGSGTGIDLSYRKNVTIKNMQIELFYYGIKLAYSINNTISGNNLTTNYISGIDFWGSSHNSIYGNNITERHSFGIKLDQSSNYNIISGNDITENGWGIKLSSSNNNTIFRNNIAANEQNGIEVFYSSNNSMYESSITNNQKLGIMLSGSSNYNSIKENNIANNGFGGIRLHSSLENSVSGNNITDHTYYYGIKLEYSLDYSISGNNIANNCWGIELEYSSNYNSIYGNDITKNEYGIWLWNSSNNRFYHNNFNNTVQVVSTIPYLVNVWDDGYPSGGNYWSDHVTFDDHSGINQDEPGSDGIVDEPYFIDEDNQDNYPLINPWVEREVGVRVGDWAKYVVETVGQHVPPELKNVDWIRNIVQDVSDTTLLVEQLWHYKNGTEKTVTGYGNVVTSDSEMCVYFISKGLNLGDTVYATYPNENLPGLTKINETISRECLSVNRETNHVNITYRGTSYDAYWDRATGIVVEVKMSYLDTLLHLEIVETNLWGAPPTASATIDMDPDTLNLRSKGQWITAYIQLPAKYNAADINATTVLLNGTISPVLDPKYEFVTNPSEYLVDYNEDGILERMVKFDKAEVMALLGVGETTLTITGEVNGEKFEGSDNIRVILPSTGCGGCRGFKR